MLIPKEDICQWCYWAGGDFISFDPIAIWIMCPDCKWTGRINKSVLFTIERPQNQSDEYSTLLCKWSVLKIK